jgi:ribosomal protein S18 acetylase RimI-like enzyme
MLSGIVVRPATPRDAGLLAEMRVRSAAERHRDRHTAAELATFLEVCARTFATKLEDGILRAWIAFDGERAVGSASLMLLPALPRIGQAVPHDGRVRNVYVDPEYRRRGVALALMREALAEAERLRVDRLVLGTSDQGRPLYERLGFTTKEDEMIFGSEED